MTHAQSLKSSNINNNNSDINFNFEENSLFQEGVMSKHFRDQTSHFSGTKRIRRPHK